MNTYNVKNESMIEKDKVEDEKSSSYLEDSLVFDLNEKSPIKRFKKKSKHREK